MDIEKLIKEYCILKKESETWAEKAWIASKNGYSRSKVTSINAKRTRTAEKRDNLLSKIREIDKDFS